MFVTQGRCYIVQLWVDRITQTWVHCSKYTGRSIRARNLEDSFVHTQQHLLHENAVLRLSLDELQQAMQAEQASAHDRQVQPSAPSLQANQDNTPKQHTPLAMHTSQDGLCGQGTRQAIPSLAPNSETCTDSFTGSTASLQFELVWY